MIPDLFVYIKDMVTDLVVCIKGMVTDLFVCIKGMVTDLVVYIKGMVTDLIVYIKGVVPVATAGPGLGHQPKGHVVHAERGRSLAHIHSVLLRLHTTMQQHLYTLLYCFNN